MWLSDIQGRSRNYISLLSLIYQFSIFRTLSFKLDGLQTFSVRYRLYSLQDSQWVARPVPSKKIALNIIMTPIYRIFLSRGLIVLSNWIFSVRDNKGLEDNEQPYHNGVERVGLE